MKTIKDDKYNVLDNVYNWILLRTVWKFKDWFFHTRFGDWFWSEILWGKFEIMPYYRPNDFQEATFSIYVRKIRHDEKMRLKALKEEIGEW